MINPPLPVTANGSAEVREASSEWHKTLYLQPGKWMQWVVATATGIVVILAGVTYMLHNAEKVNLSDQLGGNLELIIHLTARR